LAFRNTETGILGPIINQRLNIAAAKTCGVNLELQYQLELAGMDEGWNNLNGTGMSFVCWSS